MAVRIKFDSSHNVIQPTFVLATRSGKKLGIIQADDIEISDSMNSYFEVNFKVQKENNGIVCPLWDQIEDFKLLWCREFDVWFEIYVETFEENNTVKNINAISLGEAETSSTNLYGIEINTETDISRDDYEITVFYNEGKPEASLLHRIKEKLPHYTYGTVAPSLMNIQRTFTFDGISFYDALQEIAKEINCIFVFDSGTDVDTGKPRRTIDVYDLESWCMKEGCGHRDVYFQKCPVCGSEDDVKLGYGNDTTIFVTTENLAENITFTTDKDSVMNCFKLEGGDDLMTATIMNCNPNGSGYIWYVSDLMKRDMSEELKFKLAEYDADYEEYQTRYEIKLSDNELEAYNQLLENYNTLYKKFHDISDSEVGLITVKSPIVGYPALMNAYYDTIDMHLFLESEMMPIPKLQEKAGADVEAAKLTRANLSPISVQNIKNCSPSTATSSALSMAKVLVDKRYQVKTKNEDYIETEFDEEGKTIKGSWTGDFIVTDYSDESKTVTVTVTLDVNGDYEGYVKQKLEKALSQEEIGGNDVVKLFNLGLEEFKEEIKKYCLSSLETFRDACQTCLDIMIEQGVANDESWAKKAADSEESGETVTNLYDELYYPYYKKNEALVDEIKIRENEIAIIVGTYDRDGDVVTKGFQTIIVEEKEKIQEALDFEARLGEQWLEFIAYRREDTYSNENYISDGLNNRELFDRALEFVEKARKEIYKSSTLQHSITATLKNLLVMKEFEKIVDYFAVGNWIRVKINDEIYRLRLLSYTIDFNNLDNISIEFSDVLHCANGISDVESILNQAASLTKGYPSVSQQASKGNEAKKQLDDWVERSLALTKMKIVDDADDQNITWDEHGILCKQYIPVSDTYDKKQLKIINRGVYLTDDNWETSKAGIGDFVYYDPVSGEMVEAYGVIADTLVGNLILSEEVGIYNMNNSVTIDQNGLTITTHYSDDGNGNIKTSGNNALLIQKEVVNADGEPTTEQLMSIDDKGNLVLNGTIRVNTTTSSGGDKDITLDDICDEDRINNIVSNKVNEETLIINNTIEGKYKEVMDEVDYQLWEYKAEVGQYMQYDENGLTLGSTGSTNKTVIDNTGIRFKQNGSTVSYFTNNQLYIPNAVIENILVLGKFCFCPREDGGCSLTWQEDVQEIDNEIISVRIHSDDKNKTVTVGETATFTAFVTGNKDELTYQWKYQTRNGELKDGTSIMSNWEVPEDGDGSLMTTFSYTPTSIDENDTYVYIYVYYGNNNYISDRAKLTVTKTITEGSGGSTGGNEGGSGSGSGSIDSGEATTFEIPILALSATSGYSTIYYSSTATLENNTPTLSNPLNVNVYRYTSSNYNVSQTDKLKGKYVQIQNSSDIYYIDPNAENTPYTRTSGAYNFTFDCHALSPAYLINASNIDIGSGNTPGGGNEGGSGSGENESGGNTGGSNITDRTDIVVGTEQSFSAVSWTKGFGYGTQSVKYSTDVEVVDGTVKLTSANTATYNKLSNSSGNNYDVLLGKFVEGQYGGIYYIESTAIYNHLAEDSSLGERIVYSKAYPITASDNGSSGGGNEEPETPEVTTLAITKQPESKTITLGETTTISIEATGSNITYQWKIALDDSEYYQNATNLQSINCSGGKTNTITCKPLQERTFKFYCIVTDSNGNSLTSNTVNLIVNQSTPEVPDEPETPEVKLDSISVEYKGDTNVPVGTSVNSLNIVVTANYSDGSTKNVTDYSLNATTIVEGENIITVSYGEKTTTFKVNGIQQSVEEGGLVIKRGTTTSATINTGLSNIQHFMLNAPSVSAIGLRDLCYDTEQGTIYTYYSTAETYTQGSMANGSDFVTINGGTFKWSGTGNNAMTSGATYRWVAVGEE